MAKFENSPHVDDADQVPIRTAATVMIVADRPELEVLMVQRTRRAAFAASAWVFPGGRVDPDDGIDVSAVTYGLDDSTASALLEVDHGGLAWWLAAMRETVEEAGLLLGAPGADPAAVTATRKAVHADSSTFLAALRAQDLSLDLRALHEVGQFTTPVGPPRRFDTRFFVALAPPGQTASHDEEEVVEHCWIRPGEAMAQWSAGNFPMMSVTHRMLACLSRYGSAEHAIAAAQERRERMHVRVNDPDGEYLVLLPGDPGYETAEREVEHGWVRF